MFLTQNESEGGRSRHAGDCKSACETESLGQIQAFLDVKDIEFKAVKRRELCDWITGWMTGLLCQQEYRGQNRRTKGILRLYIEKMTGLSRAH